MSQSCAAPQRWTASMATVRGPRHAVNEDSHAALDAAGIFVVADGVGGATDGQIASGAVVERLERISFDVHDLETRVFQVEEALDAVNADLWRQAQQRQPATIIATTVAALVLDQHLAVCLWAGDSRIYLCRDGFFYQLTHDHTLAVEYGTLGPAGGRLTRAVGSGAGLDLGRIATATLPGDIFLVCSDGVTKVLGDNELARLLEGPIESLAQKLIGAAVDRGGTDDVTAIVLHLGGTPSR